MKAERNTNRTRKKKDILALTHSGSNSFSISLYLSRVSFFVTLWYILYELSFSSATCRVVFLIPVCKYNYTWQRLWRCVERERIFEKHCITPLYLFMWLELKMYRRKTENEEKKKHEMELFECICIDSIFFLSAIQGWETVLRKFSGCFVCCSLTWYFYILDLFIPLC